MNDAAPERSDGRPRYNGVSGRASVAMAVCVVLAMALDEAIDSWSALLVSVAGAIGLVDSVAQFRRVWRQTQAPLYALAGIVAGAAFVVLGVVLAVTGTSFDVR